MLSEYHRIIAEIPQVLVPMMKPFTDKVGDALLPGVVSLSWASLNIESCKLFNF